MRRVQGASIIASAAVLIVGVPTAIAVWSISYDPRQDLGLEYFVESVGNHASMDGIRVTTEETCAHRIGCVEARTSDHVVLTRYNTIENATTAAEASDFDTYQSDWIVVEYADPHLPESDRHRLEQALDGLWQSETEWSSPSGSGATRSSAGYP